MAGDDHRSGRGIKKLRCGMSLHSEADWAVGYAEEACHGEDPTEKRV